MSDPIDTSSEAVAQRRASLTNRLRGHYRIPITDGLGPAGGEEPGNGAEYVRTFATPPIQHEAAAEIERLAAERDLLRRAWLGVIQAENSCASLSVIGKPCDAKRCGCAAEQEMLIREAQDDAG